MPPLADPRAASCSSISLSPPPDGGEGWGEEVRFYWFPLSSVLSPLVPRGERMESLMQPWGQTGLTGEFLRACLETTRGAAARDFGCGQGGLGRAQRPAAGCKERANAGHGQKTRRPEGFRGKGRVASSSWISPSPPSDGGEGWGEEGRFYWFPLSSVLSPLVPRGERMESLMQPCLGTGSSPAPADRINEAGPEPSTLSTIRRATEDGRSR